MIFRCVLLLAAMVLFGETGHADERLSFGGDGYVSGFSPAISEPAGRDLFAAGFGVDVGAPVQGNLHAAGADVDVNADVGGNLEAAGFSVRVDGPVGRDLSVMGASINVAEGATIGGNARLMARTVSIDAPVNGSLLSAAQTLHVGGTVTGDARLAARELSFGPDARINGRLIYSAPAPVDIPASVIASDRVRFEPMQMKNASESANQVMTHMWPGSLGFFLAFLLGTAFLLVVAGLFLALAPHLTAGLQREALTSPFQTMGIGVLGLAMVVGLLPVCVITLIGLPFIPFVFLALLVLWVGGYLLGAIGLTFRVYEAFRPIPDAMPPRLLLVFVGLLVISGLNFVPIVGWLINLAVMFLGLGAILAYVGRRILKSRASQSDSGNSEDTPARHDGPSRA